MGFALYGLFIAHRFTAHIWTFKDNHTPAFTAGGWMHVYVHPTFSRVTTAAPRRISKHRAMCFRNKLLVSGLRNVCYEIL